MERPRCARPRRASVGAGAAAGPPCKYFPSLSNPFRALQTLQTLSNPFKHFQTLSRALKEACCPFKHFQRPAGEAGAEPGVSVSGRSWWPTGSTTCTPAPAPGQVPSAPTVRALVGPCRRTQVSRGVAQTANRAPRLANPRSSHSRQTQRANAAHHPADGFCMKPDEMTFIQCREVAQPSLLFGWCAGQNEIG